MKPVYLLIGVPASGKTWITDQLKNFVVVKNDDYIGRDLVAAVVKAAQTSQRPVIVDCPFGESKMHADLEKAGATVKPYFIVENVGIVAKRYKARDGKRAPNSVIARAATMADKARSWSAPSGTSTEILKLLQKV